jgi:DNA-binding transcriptional regulator YiaG
MSQTRTFAQRFAAARARTGMTITEVARRSGVAYGTVWNWESGRCTPSRDSKQLAKVAGTVPLPKVAIASLA